MPSFLGMELRGHLDLMILVALRRIGPAHGYALIAGLREQSGRAFELPEGTVYPALHRLERDGLVQSEWSTDAPRRRRVYRLTDAGAAAIPVKRAEWTVFQRGMLAVLGADVTEAPA
jgi:PadR family transcriptional regulator, regulatory protein PadR